MDSITRQGGSTSRYLSRVFRVSMISTLAAVVACIFFLRDVRFEGFRNSASDFANLILELIPEDALSPFASSNVPQLLLIGVVIGSALIVSGKSHGLISRFIHEANGIGIRITGWMSNTVPFFLCVLLAYEIMNSNTRIYTGIWQPLLIFIVLCAALMFINTYIIARKEKCDFRLLVKALMDPFIRTLKGVSADNLFNYTLRNCRDRLGIDQRFAESALAVGLVLYMPISAAGTLIFVIYAASMYNVPTTFSWFVTATVVSVAVSLAVPPVPGVGILTYVVMFAQLGIPETAMIAAMLYDVFTNLLMSAANQYMLQLDLIQSADGMAMLDKKKLRTVNA
jgi:Na+/H+-dicarboxylate symporter